MKPSLLKYIKVAFLREFIFVEGVKKYFSCRRCLKALFNGIKFREFGLSFAKISSIEIDPLTANIAIYNNSLTLMSVIFTTFLHLARNFRKVSETPSVFTYFLLCRCKRIISGPLFF